MDITISKERLEGLVSSIAKDMVKYSWIIFHTAEGDHVLIFGIDKEEKLRHFRTIIDK